MINHSTSPSLSSFLSPSYAGNVISSHASQSEESSASQHLTPTPDTTKKVNGAVNSQESQANKKDGQINGETKTKPADSPVELTEEEIKQVEELKKRDIEVRAHEAAHLAAAGQYAMGGAQFTLKKGPDGRSYAIGGSVRIDTSREPTPEATLRKADQIKRAALAPAEPSGQDRAVAAEATKMKLEAQTEISQERLEELIQQDPENTSISGQDSRDSKGAENYATSPGIEPTNDVINPLIAANEKKISQYTAISQY